MGIVMSIVNVPQGLFARAFTTASRADQYPEKPGKVSELRRQHWADQRSRTCDRGKMVAGEDPPVRGIMIDAVLQVVERRHLTMEGSRDINLWRKKGGITTVGNDVKRAGCCDDPERVHLLGRRTMPATTAIDIAATHETSAHIRFLNVLLI
jgi:hypothetical protein